MSNPAYSFTVESRLRASPAQVWAHASTFDGVNRELGPFFRMTFPEKMSQLTLETVPLGEKAFRSWILLFGILPIEFDDICLVELNPGHYFQERSRMLSIRAWGHRRTVTPAPEGCIVTDEIDFIPVLRIAGPLLALLYRWTFNWRHHRLRGLFGHSDLLP